MSRFSAFPTFPFILPLRRLLSVIRRGATLPRRLRLLFQLFTCSGSKSPLRLVVSRNIEVFEYVRGESLPRLFALLDGLECGHVHKSYSADLLDLLNAYTVNSDITARRRRCRDCARTALKKPAASVHGGELVLVVSQ